MTETLLRVRKDKMYGVAPAGADYLAVVPGGIGAVAALYKNGNWAEDLAETNELTLDVAGRAHFADDRYVISSDDERVEVWDIQENTVAFYTAPEGWLLLGAAATAGEVYWIESANAWGTAGPNFTAQVRLRSAGYDLVDPVTVRTHTIVSEFEWVWADAENQSRWFALNSQAAMMQRRADDAISSEVNTYYRVRLALSGTTSSDANTTNYELDPPLCVPDGNGASFCRRVIGGSSLGRLPDDVDAPPVDHWPDEPPWQLSTSQPSVNLAGTEVAVYGNATIAEVVVPAITRSASVGGVSTPLAQFEVHPHPELEELPSAMFIRG